MCTLPLALCAACAATASEPVPIVLLLAPVYPAAAVRAGIEGHVVIKYTITSSGTVADVSVVCAKPAGVFEDAALAAVRAWRFDTPMRRGRPIAIEGVRSRLQFQLGDLDATRDIDVSHELP
jgi:TonB family protein